MDVVQIAELLGNVGEFLGSILVLVTLIYLALQVKQSKELLEKQDRIALSQVSMAIRSEPVSAIKIDPPWCLVNLV